MAIMSNRKCKSCRWETTNSNTEPCRSCFDNSNYSCDSLKSPYDPIEKPNYYTAGKYETIDIIADQVEDYKSYLHGNCIKYLSRYRFKNGVEDLKKCKKYIEWLIVEVGNE